MSIRTYLGIYINRQITVLNRPVEVLVPSPPSGAHTPGSGPRGRHPTI